MLLFSSSLLLVGLFPVYHSRTFWALVFVAGAYILVAIPPPHLIGGAISVRYISHFIVERNITSIFSFRQRWRRADLTLTLRGHSIQ